MSQSINKSGTLQNLSSLPSQGVTSGNALSTLFPVSSTSSTSSSVSLNPQQLHPSIGGIQMKYIDNLVENFIKCNSDVSDRAFEINANLIIKNDKNSQAEKYLLNLLEHKKLAGLDSANVFKIETLIETMRNLKKEVMQTSTYLSTSSSSESAVVASSSTKRPSSTQDLKEEEERYKKHKNETSEDPDMTHKGAKKEEEVSSSTHISQGVKVNSVFIERMLSRIVIVKGEHENYSLRDAQVLVNNSYRTDSHIEGSGVSTVRNANKKIHTAYENKEQATEHVFEFLKTKKDELFKLPPGQYWTIFQGSASFSLIENSAKIQSSYMNITIGLESLRNLALKKAGYSGNTIEITHHYPMSAEAIPIDQEHMINKFQKVHSS